MKSSTPLSCYREQLQNSPDLNPVDDGVCVRTIAREDVQNICHWPARTETATENRVGQL